MFGSKASVGVDIGTNSVKVVQLKRSGSGVELEKAATVAIYPDGEKPGDPAEQRRMTVDAVKSALSQANITSKTSVSSVSGESIIVRYLQLPNMPEDELKKALQWEAEEYIPFRLDEVNIDSMVLGPSAGQDDRVDVLLVSAKKDLIEEHLSVIREAGLSAKTVDVDSFAFLNCYENNYDLNAGECLALINIGSEKTGISIMHDGQSRFTRDITVGGQTITTAIRSHSRCSWAEAESLKSIHGANPPDFDPSDTAQNMSDSLMDTIRGRVEEITGDEASEQSQEEIVARAVKTVLSELISEVRRSVEFFENQFRDTHVSKVVLGGGSSILPYLREHFEREMGLPTEIIDPLRKILANGKGLNPRDIDANRHSLAVGIGLGLRGLAA